LQRLEPGVDPHLPQPFALFLQAHHLGPVFHGDRLEQFEIDMGGKVSLARMGKDIDPLVRLQRLQGGAGAQLARPIIDDQRRPALLLEAPGDLGHQRGGGRAGLDHRALGRAAPAGRDEVIHPLGPGLEDEVLALEPHQPLEPAIGAAHQLVHRQGIEELVGDDEQRGILGQGGQIVVVVAAGEGLALEPPQRRRGLDEVDLRGKAIARRCAERVPGERAAPRAKLDIVNVLAALHPHPQVSQPQADEFAEHLADLGRGDEIALGAERIAAGIVARVALAHELGKADRAGLADEAPQALADIARGALGQLGLTLGLALGLAPRGLGCGLLGGAPGLFLGLGAGAFRGSARLCRAPGGFAGFGLGLGLRLAAGLLLGGLGARLRGGFLAAPFFLRSACPGGGFGLLARARLGGGACRSLCRGLCLVGFGRGGGRGRGRLSRRVDQPERAAPRARAPVQARACGPAVSGLLRSA